MYKESADNLVITPETKICDLLQAYPFLEEKLISITPAFSKLKNPVLRKTITRVTSLRQAAVVGNVSLNELVNKLRKEAGQNVESFIESLNMKTDTIQKPEKIKEIYDASPDLESGVHPLAKVMNAIKDLDEGECYLLVTPFLPAPLIEKVMEKNYKVKSEPQKNGSHNTYIWK